jgi:hypothetical protein
MASAVVTDIGGPLSHSSIVAREYGIPAVPGTAVASRGWRTSGRPSRWWEIIGCGSRWSSISRAARMARSLASALLVDYVLTAGVSTAAGGRLQRERGGQPGAGEAYVVRICGLDSEIAPQNQPPRSSRPLGA